MEHVDEHEAFAAFIWSVTDLLRGDYRSSDYGKVILPLTILRRLDCIAASETKSAAPSGGDLPTLAIDRHALARNLRSYIAGLSGVVQEVLAGFDFDREIARLERANLLHLVVTTFGELDLRPEKIPERTMGSLYEELVRRFSELSSDTAGEHFTPRDVIRLMTSLLIVEDHGPPDGPESTTVLDPACGSGGYLLATEERLRALNPSTDVRLLGQEINSGTLAICRSTMLMRGQDASGVVCGDSLAQDHFEDVRVDYCVSGPPFGLDWRRISDLVQDEAAGRGPTGRFGAGLPRVNDSSLLFLQHMIAKLKSPSEGGGRLAALLNGGTLFGGGAGSGESKIRRWIIENDMLEALIALPDQLFYNTRIPTYIWIITNSKETRRQGKVQLLDFRDQFERMRRPLGSKHKQLNDTLIDEIVHRYTRFAEDDRVRISPNQSFQLKGGLAPTPDVASVPDLAGRPTHWAVAPWMFLASVRTGTHRPLSDIGTLNEERVRATGNEPLLTAGDLRDRVIPEVPTRQARSGTMVSGCRAGDIVGQGRLWKVLPADVGATLTSCDVFRPDEVYRHARYLLALWLASDECQLQLSGTHLPRLSRDIRVPQRLLDDNDLGQAAIDFHTAQEEVSRLLDRLVDDDVTIDAIDDLDVGFFRERTARSDAIVRLLQPLQDPIHRAEWSFPLQVAQLARQYRLETRTEVKVDLALRLLEASIRQLGILAAASIQAVDPVRTSDLLPYFQQGISTGDWLQIIKDAQRAGTLTALPELATLSFKKKNIGALLNEAVEIRNRTAHAHGVLTGIEPQERLDYLEPLVVEVLDGLTWLSSAELLYIRSCQYRSTRAGLEITSELLVGSHPIWEPQTSQVADPIAPRQVVARLPHTAAPLVLSPFLVVKPCNQCKRHEAFVLDRVLPNGQLKARSLQDHWAEYPLGG